MGTGICIFICGLMDGLGCLFGVVEREGDGVVGLLEFLCLCVYLFWVGTCLGTVRRSGGLQGVCACTT